MDFTEKEKLNNWVDLLSASGGHLPEAVWDQIRDFAAPVARSFTSTEDQPLQEQLCYLLAELEKHEQAARPWWQTLPWDQVPARLGDLLGTLFRRAQEVITTQSPFVPAPAQHPFGAARPDPAVEAQAWTAKGDAALEAKWTEHTAVVVPMGANKEIALDPALASAWGWAVGDFVMARNPALGVSTQLDLAYTTMEDGSGTVGLPEWACRSLFVAGGDTVQLKRIEGAANLGDGSSSSSSE